MVCKRCKECKKCMKAIYSYPMRNVLWSKKCTKIISMTKETHTQIIHCTKSVTVKNGKRSNSNKKKYMRTSSSIKKHAKLAKENDRLQPYTEIRFFYKKSLSCCKEPPLF